MGYAHAKALSYFDTLEWTRVPVLMQLMCACHISDIKLHIVQQFKNVTFRCMSELPCDAVHFSLPCQSLVYLYLSVAARNRPDLEVGLTRSTFNSRKKLLTNSL